MSPAMIVPSADTEFALPPAAAHQLRDRGRNAISPAKRPSAETAAVTNVAHDDGTISRNAGCEARIDISRGITEIDHTVALGPVNGSLDRVSYDHGTIR